MTELSFIPKPSKDPSRPPPRTDSAKPTKCSMGNRKDGSKIENRHGGNGNNKTAVGQKIKKKRRRKMRRNDKRQLLSQTLENDDEGYDQFGGRTDLLESSRIYPDIIIDGLRPALDFARNEHSSDTQWILYVDGSVSPAPSPSSSPPATSSPSSPTSSLSQSRFTHCSCAAASVVYEDASRPFGWRVFSYSLPGVEKSHDAELCGIDRALQLTLDKVHEDTTFRKKVIILTDCQGSLKLLAEHLMNVASQPSEVAATASSKALQLRRLGVQLELRYVPAHMRVDGNVLADRAAKNAVQLPDRYLQWDKYLVLAAAARPASVEGSFQRNSVTGIHATGAD
ncbi:ribonuclease H family protein [Aspergillus lucknowensis]|uniref:RNase H type-1 domain-containing protein n=1 Tax=Aspergillus lucknowensis TaxID=176173 RepID=A0ABR4LVU7_9EURO